MSDIINLIKKAEEDIRIAELIYKKGSYRISVSRGYYAMFYIAEALLLTKNFLHIKE